MLKNRERLFFGISDLSAWTFTGINILYILDIYGKYIHGRALQMLLNNLFCNAWKPGNDLLYTTLNSYEEEGYIQSYWSNKSSNKSTRFMRPYTITIEGKKYLNYTKNIFYKELEDMNELVNKSMYIIWGNNNCLLGGEKDIKMSSSLFTMLNVFNFLYKSNDWSYGGKIKECLYLQYGNWKPSDGVLYPKLSILENKGFLKSRWRLDNCKNTKKRTIREYSLTDKGREHYLDLIYRYNTKNKLLRISVLTNASTNLLYGKTSKNLERIKSLLLLN